jgi:hypothetical protein
MARALTIESRELAADDRAQFVQALRARREHYKRANCNFWVFEQSPREDDLGALCAFVVFTEAADEAQLREARRGDPSSGAEALPLYRELDLSNDS